MFREQKLPFNSAMILVYEKPDLYSMWLLNIEYDLDLMWFDEEGSVVYIVEDASPCKNTLDVADLHIRIQNLLNIYSLRHQDLQMSTEITGQSRRLSYPSNLYLTMRI